MTRQHGGRRAALNSRQHEPGGERCEHEGMRVVIVGGSGHVGSYLVPRLVEAGHEVVNLARGERLPYREHSAWKRVETIQMDRVAEEAAGRFGDRVRELAPDVVIDMICFQADSARMMVDALRGRVQHFLHCGSLWVHGHSREVPTVEETPRNPLCDYGRGKVAIETLLLDEARRNGFPATVLHPGHIVGPGWWPLNPAGHFHPRVFSDLKHGRVVRLPNLGLETVHHVHADDVAQMFERAMARRSVAVGESFHVASPGAMTLRGYAEKMAEWFGVESRLEFLPWEQWRQTVDAKEAAATWDHISHSPHASIAKAQQLLGYRPRYRSVEAVQEAIAGRVE